MSEILGQIVIGWLLADLLTGAFHWWEDEFGKEEWPLVGPWLIAPNRLHHAEPLVFAAGGFAGRNADSIIAALIAAVPLVWWLGPSPLVVSLMIGAALSNEVHYFAHAPSKAPRLVRILQQTGFLQSPKCHAAHHRPPYSANYCVLTDWLNPFLEAAGVWGRLKRVFG